MADFTPISEIRAVLESGTLATARTNLGLGSVDNTADVDKPVSTATLAVTDAITARDWVMVTSDTILESSPITSWAIGVQSTMRVTLVGSGYPTSSGVVIVDNRANTFYRIFISSTGAVYTAFASGINWTTWKKSTQSDVGIGVSARVRMKSALSVNASCATPRTSRASSRLFMMSPR